MTPAPLRDMAAVATVMIANVRPVDSGGNSGGGAPRSAMEVASSGVTTTPSLEAADIPALSCVWTLSRVVLGPRVAMAETYKASMES